VTVVVLMDEDPLLKLAELKARLQEIEQNLANNRIEIDRLQTDINFWGTVVREFDPDEETDY
jgi:sensor domain CHASE-containing protein